MKEPVGNLFFAGEHTIGTHPATVHGAYMSGLRAASEVITSILGPIDVPVPLIRPRDIASLKRKAADAGITKAQVYTEEMDNHIIAQIGLPPEKRKHQSTSPFIFYSREPSVVEEARRRCDIGRRPGKGKSSWNDIRNEMAKMWKDADAETKKPFEAEAKRAKVANVEGDRAWEDKLKEWNIRYAELEGKYRADNPFVPDPVEEMAAAAGVGGRRTKAQVRSYAEPDSDEDVEMEDL
jgi:lysine-specific histone demethylase 1